MDPSFHLPEFIADPMQGLHALTLGFCYEVLSVVNCPAEGQGPLVRHVSNPHQLAGFNRIFCCVNAGYHAISAVHQERNGSVVHLNPFLSVEVVEEAAQRQENTTLVFIVNHFDNNRRLFHEYHRPRPVFSHFKKTTIHIEVHAKVLLEALEQWCDDFSAHRASFPHRPFIRHNPCLRGWIIILRQRVLHVHPLLAPYMAMWCTIRTFSKHAIELGNQPPSEPIIFVKPDGCLLESDVIPVSAHPGEVHHEVECVVVIGEDLQPTGLAVGLDLTDRAAQSALRAEQLPWAKAKCFAASAVVGNVAPYDGTWEELNLNQLGLHLSLRVNDELRQAAALSEISVTPHQQIEALKAWSPVRQGDLLFTGTPEGVGELLPGDALHAQLSNAEGTVLSEIIARCE